MNIKKWIMIIVCIAILFSLNAGDVFASEKNNFKVVGYYSEIFDDPVERVPFDKITHITYAFLIPSEDGSLVGIEKPEKLRKLIEKSHANNVQVLIAVGGWSYKGIPLDAAFEKIASSDENREKFVTNVIHFVNEYNLDGVEIDWEYPDPGLSSQNYEKLVLALREALDKKDKYLTAALNGAWSKTEGPSVSEAVTENCLQAFDWINIMSYDMNNEQHSPYWFAETSIDYWLNRGNA